jgi:WD40 repeat protein
VNALASSDRNSVLAVADVNGHVYLWDIATRKLLAAPAHPAAGGSVLIGYAAFSSDGQTLATDSSSGVDVWNVTGRG